MKKAKIIFWVTTIIIFLFEGVMPALTSQTELAKEGIRHLGYPEYFGSALVIFKILGVLALVIPSVPKNVKEWAYAGFFFAMSGAVISHLACGDGAAELFGPVLLIVLTIFSWYYRPAERKCFTN